MTESCPTRQQMNVLGALKDIQQPDRHIAVVERSLSLPLQAAIEAWLAHAPRLFLTRGTPETIEREIAGIMPVGAHWLLHDVLNLAHQYRTFSQTQELRVRLEIITGDSCRRFHVDNVPLRLLCTYAGPGVQWRYQDEETIQETRPGAITLLKGLKFPGWSEERAILHRSPPLSSCAFSTQRLLLTVDHPDACGMTAPQTLLVQA